jgi:peptidyl-prolyl cis-trans isomerase D
MGIIGSIRKHSWVAVALVGIAIVAFIFQDLSKNKNSVDDVAVINGKALTYQHFMTLVDQEKGTYQLLNQTADVPSEMERQFREQVWQRYLYESVFGEQTEKLGMQVSQEEMNDMYTGVFIHPNLSQSPQFADPSTGQYSRQMMARYINEYSKADTAWRLRWDLTKKDNKDSRIQRKYSSFILSGFYMPKAISKRIAEFSAETADVRYVALPFSLVNDSEVTLKDEDYKKYYEEHKAEFRVKEEFRELEYVAFPVNPTPADLAAIEQEVQTKWEGFKATVDTAKEDIPFYVGATSTRPYDSNYVKASTFTAPLSEQIEAASAGTYIEPSIIGNEWIMGRVMDVAMRPDSVKISAIFVFNNNINEPRITTRTDAQARHLADSVLAVVKGNKMPFSAAVEQFSDDPQKAQNKGEIGWLTDGTFGFIDKDLVNVPVGDCFMAVRPDSIGYMIVKIEDRTPAQKKYRVALIAHDIQPSQATREAVGSEASNLISRSRTIQAIEESARKGNLSLRNAQVRNMDERIGGISDMRDIVQWAYGNEIVAGTMADKVYEKDNLFMVVGVKDIYKKGYATLDQVRPAIEQQVRREKKAEMLMARAEEAVKAGKDINSIALKLNATVDTAMGISINDNHLGQYPMEVKVQAIVAATKKPGLLNPIKGASAVFVVNIDGKQKAEGVNPEMVGMQMQRGYASKVRQFIQVLMDNTQIDDYRAQRF